MRTVVAVLALVACVHAGIWALLRPQGTAPDYTGQLASVSTSRPTLADVFAKLTGRGLDA